MGHMLARGQDKFDKCNGKRIVMFFVRVTFSYVVLYHSVVSNRIALGDLYQVPLMHGLMSLNVIPMTIIRHSSKNFLLCMMIMI